MRRKDLAYINPALLTWAIDYRGVNRDTFSSDIKVKAPILAAWEMGEAHPQFNKARQIAKELKIPFVYLFLSEPPDESLPIADFRRLQNIETPYSAELLDVLDQAMLQHDWFRALLQDQEAKPLAFVSKYSINSDVSEVALDIAQTLGMDNSLRRSAGNWENYLTKLSQRAETAGIIVMRRGVVGSGHRKLNRKEFQGFAISDKLAPLVFVNGQDFQAAKNFTLIHELAHIWIGSSGISAIDESSVDDPVRIEEFCNAVATEALVPEDEFLVEWRSRPASFARIETLAKYFLVSGRVIVRRARELEEIDVTTFIKLLEEVRSHETQKKQNKKGTTGNFYTTLDSRNSPKFVEALISDVRREGTTYREAARLLSMRVPTVVKMAEAVNTS